MGSKCHGPSHPRLALVGLGVNLLYRTNTGTKQTLQEGAMTAPTIGRRDLELLLIGLGANDHLDNSLGGITRLQKYLFLLEREGGVTAAGKGFTFEPYKAGPYSSKVYDDLEFLENLGLLHSEVTANSTEWERPEVERLTFDQLLGTDGGGDEGAGGADAYEERRFKLTDKGADHVRRLLADPQFKPVVDGIRKIKSRFGNHSLSDLLYHVYTKYPEMATESEIRDKVLRRGRAG